MENRYHYKLNLPVKFVPRPVEFGSNLFYAHISKYGVFEVNFDLRKFLESLGVSVIAVEVFGRKPNIKGLIHLDGDKLSDDVKINYVYGEGIMNWYNLKPGSEWIQEINTGGTYHIRANDEDCEKVWSASIDDSGSLVNVGGLHGISDVKTIRWCYCLMLGDIANDNKRLQWDRALELFQGYY